MTSDPNPLRNLAKAIRRVREAKRRGAQIVCLQELFLHRYFPQTENKKNFELAEPIPGPTTRRFEALARESKMVLIVPLFERRSGNKFHNSAVVIDADGKRLGTYRKMHIPEDPGFYEKYYFTPGNLGFRVYQTKHASLFEFH